jgi:hypothetical protein
MPGRLRSSFRSGNLAEDLGVLLLKGIAAVAVVPRTEDIGLDAIATLLRRASDRNCYAEDGFVVQLKSYSETSIKYRDHELFWLLGQSQPMFIGRVLKPKSRISLHPTLFVNQAALALDPKQITIEFGYGKYSPIDDRYARTGTGSNSATVWIGEPLLEWTLSELEDPTWMSSAYETMKRFLAIAHREHDLLTLGQCSHVVWKKMTKIQSNHPSR